MTTEGFAEDGTMLKDYAQLDLAEELADFRQKKPWPMGHYARSLYKKADLRVVLIAMEKGSMLKDHHADGAISVQVVSGVVRFSAQQTDHVLKAGNLAMLAASIKHEVEALEDSAILLTISWPEGVRLEAMQHRGYGT